GYELVIAVGGDGTVHEIINGLMQVPPEQRPKLGVVPLGSGNDFSHAIGMDPRPAFALRQVFTGQPKRVDVGRLLDGHGRQEYFNNTLGIGFDAAVTIRSRNFAMVRGFLIYFIAVLQTIILNHDAPRMQVATDRETWDEEMLMLVLCNGGREGGGFLVAPDARIDDEVLHYAGVRRVSRPMMIRLVPEVMRGTHGNFSQVRMGQFTRMSLQADRPLYIHIDGEIFAGFGVDVRKLDIEIFPGAIEVIR
ncbi:MAG: hypothetical protein H6Q38_2457, partial [Chloroflexi bacterium]|nr:hypothetical protein [Chloroflexota bacterium]